MPADPPNPWNDWQTGVGWRWFAERVYDDGMGGWFIRVHFDTGATVTVHHNDRRTGHLPATDELVAQLVAAMNVLKVVPREPGGVAVDAVPSTTTGAAAPESAGSHG